MYMTPLALSAADSDAADAKSHHEDNHTIQASTGLEAISIDKTYSADPSRR